MQNRLFFSRTIYWDKPSATINANGQPIHRLSKKEAKLLIKLSENAGHVVEFETIMRFVWDGDSYYDNESMENSLRELVSRVKKINPAIAECIVNRKGIGYQFVAPKTEGNESIVPRLATLEQLKKAGMTTLDVAERLVANDYALYGDLGGCEGSPSTWQSFMDCYPQTFRFLVDEENNIIGNWSLLAPSEKHLRLIESGNIQESLFRPSDTEFLLSPRQAPYVGFLLNFSVNAGFQAPQNIKLLFDAFCEQLLSWAQFGIYFSKFYVNCFRGDHGKMFESFGFTKKVQNKPHGTIYLLDLIHLPTFGYWTSNETLLRTYHDYFSSIM